MWSPCKPFHYRPTRTDHHVVIIRNITANEFIALRFEDGSLQDAISDQRPPTLDDLRMPKKRIARLIRRTYFDDFGFGELPVQRMPRRP